MAKWMIGSPDWTMPVCNIDARPGGTIRYEWTTRRRPQCFHLTGEYIAVQRPHRLVHVERMFLPDPTPDNRIETTFTAKARRHFDGDAHDPARCRNPRHHDGHRHDRGDGFASYDLLEGMLQDVPGYAVRPTGSGSPFARQQAVSVLASRQAMVIGPTPPGTGVIAPATADGGRIMRRRPPACSCRRVRSG